MNELSDLPENRYTKILDRAFHIKNNFIDAGHGCILPKRYRDISEQIKNFDIRTDDVFLCSFPRSGSTWLQEILWLLGNNLDFSKARVIIQQVRNPTLELSALFSDDKNKADWIKDTMKGNSVEFAHSMTSQRFLKTHLPWHLLPDKLKRENSAKIIYTTRNPKDQIVSFYHYCLLAHQMDCSFEDFIDLCLEDKIVYGSPLKHMLPFYDRRNQQNILFIKYEDMKKDLPAIIRQCAKHLEIKRELTNRDIEEICDYVKFEKMEKNSSVNLETIVFRDQEFKTNIDSEQYNKVKFIRKGCVGDWQNYFTSEINEKFDKWIEEQLKSSDMTFDYV
ncbi:CLUMA_CG020149, isoform A [Clunio marinus]|uniref:CLUMA_CG020149, isoform A n=1 Tax=Clunio marinus TaxID=568069 RepID=A0A1J1J6P9_9DIPT|nr:CLUMA_CG020149, isoform A [Clunio marinus]